jgi:molybdate transport system substrate-binding protein
MVGAARGAENRDLVVFAEPTLAPALAALATAWHVHGAGVLRVFKSPTALALAQADHHIRCDLVIGLTGPAFDKVAKDETIDTDTTASFATNTLVLIAQGDTDRRSAAAGDLAGLIAGKRVAVADPERDLSGRYGLAALRRAGIVIDPFDPAIPVAESSAGVITYLAEGRADFGIVYATDAKAAGFADARPMPDGSYPPIVYVLAAVDEPQRAPDDFLGFLKTGVARGILATAGLAPPAMDEAKGHDDR